MGARTLESTQKLRYAIELAADLEARQVHDGDMAPMRRHLDEHLRKALDYEESWAFFAHGNQMDSTQEFLEFRRGWYDWTKNVDALTAALQLSPAELGRL